MSLFSASGPRPAAAPTPPPVPTGAGQATAPQSVSATGVVAARLATVDPVTLQDAMVNISQQGLQAPAGAARSTSESAQSLMNTFARRLFGDEAATASVAYNLASFSTAITDSARPAGAATVNNGTLELDRRASFIGIGQIATEDGRTFDFELKVKYTPKTEAADTAGFRERPALETPDMLVLTGKPLPAIEFPGSLDDLFRLLSRELRTEVSSGPGQKSDAPSGDLTLRLMRLVDQAALLAPRARSDAPESTPELMIDRARAVATTYGSAPAGRGPSQA